MAAYYNEIEPYAAEWLRNLIRAGHIADGEVDTRSIINVAPDDLRGFTQCHFFAGIGVWSYALRLAGWPDDRPVWTGSCPCQPFSAAGKKKGFNDDRHLWPVWHNLIRERRPSVVFGEQVASKDGLNWLDLVHADMEATNYAIGAFDLCAAGVGAPHIRQRLYFVAERMADASDERHERYSGDGRQAQRRVEHASDLGWMDDSNDTRLERYRGGYQNTKGWDTSIRSTAQASEPCGLADAGGERCDGEQVRLFARPSRQAGAEIAGRGGHGGLADARRPGPTNGHWRAADWLGCRDGRWRPVEPGTFPLAHGSQSRARRLRAYGNAIVPQVAAEVIGAFLEAQEGR